MLILTEFLQDKIKNIVQRGWGITGQRITGQSCPDWRNILFEKLLKKFDKSYYMILLKLLKTSENKL